MNHCVDSILCQSDIDFELILVDDGSDDKSLEICNRYNISDARVQVLHQSHMGVIKAKNMALSHVTGEYVTFVDSDDTVSKDYLQVITRKLSADTDMLIWGMQRVIDGVSGEITQYGNATYELENETQRAAFMIEQLINYRIGWENWGRLYRMEPVRKHNIRFAENTVYFEDLVFTFHYCLYCKKIVCAGEYILYNYTVRDNSSSVKLHCKTETEYLKCLCNILVQFEEIINKVTGKGIPDWDFFEWEFLEWHTREKGGLWNLLSQDTLRRLLQEALPGWNSKKFQDVTSNLMKKYGNSCGLVSVIIPVYNIENFLEECIASVRYQTYSKVQIILIDDGSRDDCAQICDQCAAKDSRIQVIHKENGGLSSARNVGIENAFGEYLYFLDGDDYIEKDLIEKAVITLEKRHSDMCIFKADQMQENHSVPFGKTFEYGEIAWKTDAECFDFLTKHYLNYEYGWEAWSYVIRKKVVDNFAIRFINEREVFAEDMLFSMSYLLCAKSISLITDVLYHYRLRDGSLMDEKNRRIQFTEFDLLCRAFYAFIQKTGRNRYFLCRFYIIYAIIMKRHYDWMSCLYSTEKIMPYMLKGSKSLFSKKQIIKVLCLGKADLFSEFRRERCKRKVILFSILLGTPNLYPETRRLFYRFRSVVRRKG